VPYFRVVKNKCEDDYKRVIIANIFVNIPKIIFKVFNFECIIS
jgi:hypothetical protein